MSSMKMLKTGTGIEFHYRIYLPDHKGDNMEREESTILGEVLKLAKQLIPLEKVQLIKQVIPDLESPLEALGKENHLLQSAYGICVDLGPAPSAEEIDEARSEVF